MILECGVRRRFFQFTFVMKPFLFLLSGMVFLLRRRRSFLDVNHRYLDLLKRQGLDEPEDFLALPAVIVSGHADRNVSRVKLGTFQVKPGHPAEITAYLKREHRLIWRDRMANAWAGFGWCSKSYREAQVLRAMREQGVSCPEWVAAGEDKLGRAFVLVRELSEGVDLRVFLQQSSHAKPVVRHDFARTLGEALAHLHDAGFNHPDLYSKHVLVNPGHSAVSLLDCQRSLRLRNVTWAQRWHDLAVLDATLADDLVAPRERLWCLRSYLRAVLATRAPRPFWRKAQASIRRQAARLLRHRHVREARQPPLPADSQNLLWVRGEGLCVTRQFHDALQGRIPEQLLLGRRRSFPSVLTAILVPFGEQAAGRVTHCQYNFRGIGAASLVQRRASHPWRWLWSWIRGRRLTSPELEQAGIIFRLERYGVRTVQVLAFGQSLRRPWQVESFLLLQDQVEGISPERWLAEQANGYWTAELKRRWRTLRQLGTTLRRIHEACCYLPDPFEGSLLIDTKSTEHTVFSAAVERICRKRKPSRNGAKANLISLIRSLHLAALSRTDKLRLILSYVGERRLSLSTKELARILK
jgi:tRNA A-37 threonylcarbamoyl transferase component Bud32